MASAVAGVARDIVLGDLPEGMFQASDPTDVTITQWWETLRAAVDKAARDLAQIANNLTLASTQFGDAMGPLGQKASEAKERYEQLVATLQSEGVKDPLEYGKWVQERHQLETDLHVLAGLEAERATNKAAWHKAWSNLEAIRKAWSDAREKFLSEVLSKNTLVRMKVKRFGDRPRDAEASFRQKIEVTDARFSQDILADDDSKGLLVDLYAGEFSSKHGEFLEKMRQACEGESDSGLSTLFAKYLAKRTRDRSEFLDDLLTWFPPDSLDIEYSPRGDGKEFRSIDQARRGSARRRCSHSF